MAKGPDNQTASTMILDELTKEKKRVPVDDRSDFVKELTAPPPESKIPGGKRAGKSLLSIDGLFDLLHPTKSAAFNYVRLSWGRGPIGGIDDVLEEVTFARWTSDGGWRPLVSTLPARQGGSVPTMDEWVKPRSNGTQNSQVFYGPLPYRHPSENSMNWDGACALWGRVLLPTFQAHPKAPAPTVDRKREQEVVTTLNQMLLPPSVTTYDGASLWLLWLMDAPMSSTTFMSLLDRIWRELSREEHALKVDRWASGSRAMLPIPTGAPSTSVIPRRDVVSVLNVPERYTLGDMHSWLS
jgi:hypothetical protein